ncbi:MAG: hypothetical protein EVA65_04670 [Oceanococcus sp.]|nr:MAG: hypothetical protein EVA65_04670 [Oceanococcus sp.]
MKNTTIWGGLMLLLSASVAFADSQNVSAPDTGNSLKGFNFAPALYFLHYDEEVLTDSKDVRTRSNGTVEALGRNATSAIGLEVHFNIPLASRRVGYGPDLANATWTSSWGLNASPFFGVFDVDDGIKGFVLGGMMGVWRGDKDFGGKTALGVGAGYFIHNDQLVLASELKEGETPPAGLDEQDYTTRKNVEGWALMLTVSLGF